MPQQLWKTEAIKEEPLWKSQAVAIDELDFTIGRGAVASLRALGRTASTIAGETIASPGTLARATTGAAATFLTTERGVSGLAPSETLAQSRRGEALAPGRRQALLEQMGAGERGIEELRKFRLKEERDQRIQEQAFEIGEVIAKPFEKAGAAVRSIGDKEFLRKVFNLDSERPFIQKVSDPRWWTEDFAEMATSAVALLAPGVGASKVGRLAGLGKQEARQLGFKVSSALIFASETGSSQEWAAELERSGLPKETSAALASQGKVLYGAVSGVIERGVLPAQFSGGGTGIGGWIYRRFIGGAGEVTEEGLQALTSALARDAIGLDPNLEFGPEAAIAAFLPGSVISGGRAGVKAQPVATVVINDKERGVTQEQVDRITSAEGTPSRNDLRGVAGADKLSASQRAEIKSDIQEQLNAQSRIEEEPARQPTQAQEEDVQPQVEPQVQAQEEVAGTAKVRALDRSTGEITDISVAPENTVQTLRGERRTRGQLNRLQNCLSRA